MPRRGHVTRRPVSPDAKYGDRLVGRFINTVMRRGKKTVAERVVYGALEVIQQRTTDDPVKVFKKALDNVKPLLEVRSRRVGGSTYQVPIEVRTERRVALGMRWLIQYAGTRPEKTMVTKLAGEVIEASLGRGNAVKKREDTHRMAEANKAFAHYNW